MSRIFDNIQQELLQALRATLEVSKRADFCIGYLNLRGWQAIDDTISSWDPAEAQVCRVLVRMQESVSFKLNAGKQVGNFNLAKLRPLTDQTDQQICERLGWESSLWQEIELLYAHTVKTQLDDVKDD